MTHHTPSELKSLAEVEPMILERHQQNVARIARDWMDEATAIQRATAECHQEGDIMCRYCKEVDDSTELLAHMKKK